jgi:SSS family solute:Na+ symporter
MANSTSTIFTLDIYKNFIDENASEKKQVRVGRITAVLAFVIAAIVAPALRQLDQAFQYIQEYTGFISPGVFAIFVFGFFWKKTTANAALSAAALTIPLSTAFKFLTPGLPFIDRMGIVFLIISAVIIAVSLYEGKGKDNPKRIEITKELFTTSAKFKIGATLIAGILAALYIVFW